MRRRIWALVAAFLVFLGVEFWLSLSALHLRVGGLGRRLEAAELAFSDTLHESQETLEDRFRADQLAALAPLLALVLALGLWTTLRLEREVKQREEAERALTASQVRLQEILDHSTILFYSRDRDHRITYVSPCPGPSLVASCTDGSLLWVEVDETPVVRDGETVGLVGSLSDVTERKRAEKEHLAFSRRQVVEPRVLDLNRAVRDSTAMLRRLIGEDVRMELGLHASPATVLLDPSQVDQVLVNLAVNARDEMPCGGRLAIGTDFERRNGYTGDGPVDLPPGEYVVLTVTDDGEDGYSVLEAPESTSALALFEEHNAEIDLLITDLVLPGNSGEGLAARIAEARPDLPVLLISGYSETFLSERGVVREGLRLLQKPFEAGELLARVEDLTGVTVA